MLLLYFIVNSSSNIINNSHNVLIMFSVCSHFVHIIYIINSYFKSIFKHFFDKIFTIFFVHFAHISILILLYQHRTELSVVIYIFHAHNHPNHNLHLFVDTDSVRLSSRDFITRLIIYIKKERYIKIYRSEKSYLLK